MAHIRSVTGRCSHSGLLSAAIKHRHAVARLLFGIIMSIPALALFISPLAAHETKASLENGVVLVMIEEHGCAYCKQWLAQVGPGYGKSKEGLRAPLVRIDRTSKEADRFERVVYTPTFLLLRDGKELGRILGYAGADLFWWQLTDLLQKHVTATNAKPPMKQAADSSSPGSAERTSGSPDK